MNRIASGFFLASLLAWPGTSFAYRPFDSTDAAVAELGELEIELGPVQFRRSGTERTVIGPAYVLNYGFAKNWEVVLEGQGEHPLPPADDTRSRLVDNGVFVKGVLREGVLQDKPGPSIATEFGILLPGINDEHGMGASWLGIVSQRWAWGTMHFDAGAALTRDHHADLFLGTIIEGPHEWKVRPVAEVTYEREFNAKETFGILAGAIWQVRDNLALDVGLREAWINHRAETEIRAGLTFAISPQHETAERIRQSVRQ
jgi:hypothetical protein